MEPVTVGNLEQVSFDKTWSLSMYPELLMHSVHSYPAKFPALIATKAIDFAREEKVSLGKIADVFCGCGTVPLEAKIHGIDFWGTDINPVATLIARAKSQNYNVKKLENYLQKICSALDSSDIRAHNYLSSNERIQYWFTLDAFEELDKLLQSIYLNVPKEDNVYRDAFLCVFSSILKMCSRWLMKSIKPQVDPSKKQYSPLHIFKRNARRFIDAVKEINTEVLDNGYSPRIDIEQTNFLTRIKPPMVDLIVSSPPYVTSYEYADLHQLSSLWLGYTDDYRSLRKGSVGSSYGCDSKEIESVILNETAVNLITRLQKAKVQPAKIRAIERYYKDMQVTVAKCFSMLNDNGMVLFVIGDTEYKGVQVTNASQLVESMEQTGFTDLKACKRTISQKLLTPYRDDMGRFTSNKQKRAIYHEEFVISARKYAA